MLVREADANFESLYRNVNSMFMCVSQIHRDAQTRRHAKDEDR